MLVVKILRAGSHNGNKPPSTDVPYCVCAREQEFVCSLTPSSVECDDTCRDQQRVVTQVNTHTHTLMLWITSKVICASGRELQPSCSQQTCMAPRQSTVASAQLLFTLTQKTPCASPLPRSILHRPCGRHKNPPCPLSVTLSLFGTHTTPHPRTPWLAFSVALFALLSFAVFYFENCFYFKN